MMNSLDHSSFRGHYEAVTASIRLVRRSVTGYLSGHGVDPSTIERVTLALSELCTNAVEAADGVPQSFRVEAEVTGGGDVRCLVANRASLRDLPAPEDWGPTDPMAPRGRGLAIVRSVADELTVAGSDGEVLLEALFRADPPTRFGQH